MASSTDRGAKSGQLSPGAEMEPTDTLQDHLTATISPADTARMGDGETAIAVLQKLASGPVRDQLDVTRTLGRGGMGEVKVATQLTLDREVVVKTLRADRKSKETVLALLREAWVIGVLEHPNVVPVHDIGLDADGAPFIVLKRIDGVTWGTLMHDPEAVRDRFGVDDQLEWNLGVLLQVMNAVKFAHNRGLIHRDIKPENVMVGEFGEVYVLDWGLALSLRDDRGGRLPLARHARTIAGTLAYMAPEMLGDEDIPLSERTDIYLLGAVLFEIIAGHPPHTGASDMKIMREIVLSSPEFPDVGPADLIRICRRAMDPDPTGRFERVEQFRLAIQDFLQHRGSARLAERAEGRLDELRRHLRGDGSPDRSLAERAGDAGWRSALYRIFGACRFGFQEAHRAWHGNEQAARGLRSAITLMAEHELDAGQPRTAAALMAELADPPAELARRIDEAIAAKEAEKARIAALEQQDADLDPATGARTRLAISGGLGVFWTMLPLGLWLADDAYAKFTYATGYVAIGGVLVVLVLLLIWARESLMKTAVNRRVFGAIALIVVAQMLLMAGGHLAAVPPMTTLVMSLFMWSVASGCMALAINLMIWPVSVAYVAAFFLSGWRPELTMLFIAAANAVIIPTALVSWRKYRHLYRA